MEKESNNLPPICDYEGSTYQTTFWEQGDRAYEDRVEAIALQRLLPPAGDCLLELGAGAGRHTRRYRGFRKIVLLDYSLTQLQQAQERLGRDSRYLYVAANIYDLPFVPGLFETATMIRVIHHLVEAKSALAQVRQVLRPEGVFILEFANKQNLKAILRYLLRRQSWNPFSPEPIEFVKLNFDFHPRTTRKWLAEVGFAVERQLTVSHFRLGLFKRLLPLHLLVSLDAMVQPTGNWWQLTPSVFVRARAVGDTPIAEPGSFFRCLTCSNSRLQNKEDYLWCPSCHTKWGIRDGIYDFKNPLT